MRLTRGLAKTMRAIIAIFSTIIGFNAYAQKDLAEVGKHVLSADSVIIYSTFKSEKFNLSDSSCCTISLFANIFQDRVKLTERLKKELADIFIKPSDFGGRYPSRSGFLPTKVIVLWKNGSAKYAKVSRRTHDILFSDDFKWFKLDPLEVTELDKFYDRIRIKND